MPMSDLPRNERVLARLATVSVLAATTLAASGTAGAAEVAAMAATLFAGSAVAVRISGLLGPAVRHRQAQLRRTCER